MIYTVTLNPAIDKTVEIPLFTAGTVNRTASLREDAGGKGINVSKCLKILREPSVAALITAGEAGRHLMELTKREGLTVLTVETEGQTRTNLKIIASKLGQNTDINEPGPQVRPETLRQLLGLLCDRINPGDVVVLSGSLPQGAAQDTYRRWTQTFSALGANVFLDADGICMAEGIQGRPYMVKPNAEELARALKQPMETEQQLLAGGKALLEMGISNAVVSLGSRGALFFWEDGIYRAKSLPVPVGSTVGAGDSMVAAMAYGLANGLSREAQIRLSMAMGAASVMQSGSQAPDAETVQTLARQVEFEKWQ